MAGRRAILATAGVGVVAAICCASPLIGIALGSAGIAALLSGSIYVLAPAALLILIALGIWHFRSQSGREAIASNKAEHHE